MSAVLRALLAVGAAGLVVAALCAWLALRPNRSRVHPAIASDLEHWDAVADGEHNSNTDMIAWGDDLLLVHAASPYHLGTPRSRLVVRRSRDGRVWEQLAELRVPGQDVRDPKLVPMGGRLFLYALTNDGVMAQPDTTVLSTSDDAVHWSDWDPVGPEGWLFWRPKTRDGETWYVPAYWHDHGRSMLLRSRDGRRWEEVSILHEGEGNDETAIEFLPDGRLLATARLEISPDSILGHRRAHTLLAVAEPPYTSWTKQRSFVARLDGPVLFPLDGRVFAVARYQPGPFGPLTRMASVLSRKRTALYEVTAERLVYLSDLPSAGDTSYAGAVVRDGLLYTDYYTNDVRRDVPWLIGMFQRSDIRMATLPTESLRRLADEVGRADSAAASD